MSVLGEWATHSERAEAGQLLSEARPDENDDHERPGGRTSVA